MIDANTAGADANTMIAGSYTAAGSYPIDEQRGLATGRRKFAVDDLVVVNNIGAVNPGSGDLYYNNRTIRLPGFIH